MKLIIEFSCALLFALGLGVSGMTLPENIIGFLNIFGDWKPALILVMVGGIAVHMLTYRWILKRASPLFDTQFYLPTRKDVDLRLIVGSLMFGTGWGLAGFCPGPAIVSLASLDKSVFLFVAAMLAGMGLYTYLINRLIGKKS